jgi:hypothetical protein
LLAAFKMPLQKEAGKVGVKTKPASSKNDAMEVVGHGMQLGNA